MLYYNTMYLYYLTVEYPGNVYDILFRCESVQCVVLSVAGNRWWLYRFYYNTVLSSTYVL